MSTDNRRGFIRRLGLAAAAVPAAGALAETEVIEVPPSVQPGPARLLSPAELLGVPPQHAAGGYLELTQAFYYSGLTVEANSLMNGGELTFFVDSLGSLMRCGARADYNITNMQRACQFPPPTYVAVTRIGLLFSRLTVPKLADVFADRYSLRLQVGNKTMLTAPLSSLYSTADVVGDVPGFGNTVVPPHRLFQVDREGLALEMPVLIEPQQYFCVTVAGPGMKPHGKLKMWVFIAGRQLRSVQ